MAGYDPRLDPNLQAALAANGSQYAPFELPAGSAPFTPDEMAVMNASAQPNAPGMSFTPEPMQPGPQVLPGGQPLPLPGPQAPQSAAAQPAYTEVPLSHLSGQPLPAEDGYRMPDLTQLGQRRGGSAPVSQAKKKMEGAFGGMTDAITQRQEAAREIADTRAGVGRSMADIRDNANVDDEMYAQRMADEAERHQAAVDAVQTRQREDADFIRTFEPSDRRSTTQKAMSAVAVALSGLGDAVALGGGNQNPGHMKVTLGIIDKAIDRDLEYQREMLNNKRTALAAGNTELGQMRERYGDNLDAMKMARVVKLDQYQRAIDTAIQQGASAEAVAAGKDTQAQLELQKQQLMYEVYGAQYQAEMRARAGGGAMGQLKLQEQMLKNEKLRGEVAAGPDGDKLSGDERKVQRSLGAVRPAFERLRGVMDSGNIPYLGVRSGTQSLPDAIVPNENIQYRNDVMAVAGQALRDDSGAVLGPAELSDKLERMGVFSGNAEMRAQGLKDLQYEYESRLNRGKATQYDMRRE